MLRGRFLALFCALLCVVVFATTNARACESNDDCEAGRVCSTTSKKCVKPPNANRTAPSATTESKAHVDVGMLVLGASELGLSVPLIVGGIFGAAGDTGSGGNGAIGFLVIGAGALLVTTGFAIVVVWALTGHTSTPSTQTSRVLPWVLPLVRDREGVSGGVGGLEFSF